MTAFVYHGPLDPDTDSALFQGREEELKKLTEMCLGTVRHYAIVYGGRQTGKTSLMLRLEKQLAELQGKISTAGPDPALLRRVDALSQKVEALEKQKLPAAESKAKPVAAPKPAASTQKKYHTVQKGDTLYGISKKYGIGVEELRKLNNLSAGQSLRTGQKLVVSAGR